MANPINSTKAAELIEAVTGRPCSRQNLEKHCVRGALRDSPCILQAKPLRVDAETVVAEFQAKVAPHQVEASQPYAKRPMPSPRRESVSKRPPVSDGPPPDYTESRARHEFEKANLAELQRKTQEGLLLRRDDVTTAWRNAVNLTRTKLLGVPSTVRARIPHLEPDEVEVITLLIREALEELAGGEIA